MRHVLPCAAVQVHESASGHSFDSGPEKEVRSTVLQSILGGPGARLAECQTCTGTPAVPEISPFFNWGVIILGYSLTLDAIYCRLLLRFGIIEFESPYSRARPFGPRNRRRVVRINIAAWRFLSHHLFSQTCQPCEPYMLLSPGFDSGGDAELLHLSGSIVVCQDTRFLDSSAVSW